MTMVAREKLKWLLPYLIGLVVGVYSYPPRRLITYLAFAVIGLGGAMALHDNHYAQAVWLLIVTALLLCWGALER